MTIIDSKKIDWFSDTTLYKEARDFCKQHPTSSNKQMKQLLKGLAASNKSWRVLIDYIEHQLKRDTLKGDDKDFYDALQQYLDDSRTGLRQRVETEFHLVNTEGMSKKEAKDAKEAWAQELAQEFINHLVAEALWLQVVN